MGTKNLKKNVMPGFAANELHQEANDDDDDCREEALYKNAAAALLLLLF